MLDSHASQQLLPASNYSPISLTTISHQKYIVFGGHIFGRISPEQKEHIVDCLLKEKLRVAMMGDGVNDVLPIKKASLGIAMESGSNATRNVADMILLDDSFAALRPASLAV